MASAEPIPGRCGARSASGSGKFCTQYPINGTTRCKMHGGAAPQTVNAAARRQQEAAVEALAVTYGLPVQVDPVDALLGELWRTQGAVLWLEAQIRKLDPAALTWGTTEVAMKNATQFAGTDTIESAAVHPLLEIYHRERKHLAQLSKDCVTVGIELRMQQRMKDVGAQFHELLTRVVGALGHDVQDPMVVQVVTSEMRALVAG